MPKTDAFNDEEVRIFVDRLPRHLTFSEMASACLGHFSTERAWSRSKIIRYWQAANPVHKGRAARVDADEEVKEFLEDLFGRRTLDELVAACRARFGAERSPSRSAIHRYWMRARRRRTTQTTADADASA